MLVKKSAEIRLFLFLLLLLLLLLLLFLLQEANLGVSEWLSRLSDQLLISAQVMISRLVRLCPMLGSALSAEPAWDSLSAHPHPPTCACT